MGDPSSRGSPGAVADTSAGGGRLSWLSLRLARSARALGPGEAGVFEPREHERCLRRPSLFLYLYLQREERTIDVQALFQGAWSFPPLHLDMWVENEGEKGRREPWGGFRPQTLPLWECVQAEPAPEQNN